MADKLPISGFVDFLGQQVAEKAGYIMSSYGQNPRTGYLDLSITECKSAWKPNGYYYTQYDGKQREKALYWRETSKRVFDCQGLSEGYYEIMTGICVNTRARYNYSGWCDPKGTGLIPAKYRVPGAAVFWGDTAASITHVAYLYKPVNEGDPAGDWYIIEARGVMYGVVMTRLNQRKPKYWGIMSRYFCYGDFNDLPEDSPAVSTRTLKNGMEGEDVRQLQAGLIRLGYDCGRWGADGDFGDATESALIRFQADHGLEVDGKYGPQSRAALEAELVKLETPTDKPRTVRISGGNCYVRSAPNTDGQKLGVARDGEKLPYGGVTSEDGWHLVEYNGQNGWVGGKYSQIEEE